MNNAGLFFRPLKLSIGLCIAITSSMTYAARSFSFKPKVNIAIVNLSTQVSKKTIQRIEDAISQQVLSDFQPIYGVNVNFVDSAPTALDFSSVTPIFVVDRVADAEQIAGNSSIRDYLANMSAFGTYPGHTVVAGTNLEFWVPGIGSALPNLAQLPLGAQFALVPMGDANYGVNSFVNSQLLPLDATNILSHTLSREVLEILANSGGRQGFEENVTLTLGSPDDELAFHVSQRICDPVKFLYYRSQNFTVSDFVYPAFFDAGPNSVVKGPFDHLQAVPTQMQAVGGFLAGPAYESSYGHLLDIEETLLLNSYFTPAGTFVDLAFVGSFGDFFGLPIGNDSYPFNSTVAAQYLFATEINDYLASIPRPTRFTEDKAHKAQGPWTFEGGVPTLHISVINQMTGLQDFDALRIIAAVQAQVSKDWKPIWGTDVRFDYYRSPDKVKDWSKSIPAYFIDSVVAYPPQDADGCAWHGSVAPVPGTPVNQLTISIPSATYIPDGSGFIVMPYQSMLPCINHDFGGDLISSLSFAFSHEVLETLGDYYGAAQSGGDLLVDSGYTKNPGLNFLVSVLGVPPSLLLSISWAAEVADPVTAIGTNALNPGVYKRFGLPVSDFVYPEFFNIYSTDSKFDFLGYVPAPWTPYGGFFNLLYIYAFGYDVNYLVIYSPDGTTLKASSSTSSSTPGVYRSSSAVSSLKN